MACGGNVPDAIGRDSGILERVEVERPGVAVQDHLDPFHVLAGEQHARQFAEEPRGEVGLRGHADRARRIAAVIRAGCPGPQADSACLATANERVVRETVVAQLRAGVAGVGIEQDAAGERHDVRK
jgi:hypothetical protein